MCFYWQGLIEHEYWLGIIKCASIGKVSLNMSIDWVSLSVPLLASFIRREHIGKVSLDVYYY